MKLPSAGLLATFILVAGISTTLSGTPPQQRVSDPEADLLAELTVNDAMLRALMSRGQAAKRARVLPTASPESAEAVEALLASGRITEGLGALRMSRPFETGSTFPGRISRHGSRR